MEEGDEDVYVTQLKELFASCDTDGRGMIGAEELVDLCSKLQLEGQADFLVEQLVGNDASKLVDFETFKEAFVMVLSSAVDLDGIDAGTDQEYSIASAQDSTADLLDPEVSPRLIKGGRRYGRRSKPDFELTAEFSDMDSSDMMEPKSLAEELGPMPSIHGSSEQTSDVRKTKSLVDNVADDLLDDQGDIFDHDDREVKSGSHSHSNSVSQSHKSNPADQIKNDTRNETFEAEGQMAGSMSVYEQGPSEAEQVQAIWEEVGVGKDGFLDINELAVVCEHIGMEDMDGTELKNLFKKLDQDNDGRVGFEEFLDGLFRTAGIRTPAPLTPIAPTPSLLTAKRRMAAMGSAMDDPVYRTATPSLLLNQAETKLFSVLDPENTGYAAVDAVSEQLEDQGIHNPQEVLEVLEVHTDPSGRVSLQDISSALDQVLLMAGEDNGVYQAALTTYQSELKYLRSQNDQLTAERDKLKMDINEANRQNIALVQEIDDRHATIEKTNEKKLRDTERKFQEKIASLQAQLDKEREMLTSQASNQTSRLLDEMEQIKADESTIKERYQTVTEENSRLEQELGEAIEKLRDYEKTVTKQQRDLDGFQELEERLADLESSRDGVSKQQEVYFEQNIRDLQENSRLLQDRVDELTQENELLKHQASERKLRRKGSKFHNAARRVGSVLGDYQGKPNIVKRIQNSSSDNDSELDELDPNKRKAGGGIPEEDEETSEEQSKQTEQERAKLAAKIESLKLQHGEELEEVRENFEKELKEVEKKHRMETKEMETNFEDESAKMRQELEDVEKSSDEERTRLLNEFEAERVAMNMEFEQEKAALEEAFEIVKTELEETLRNEFAEELDRRITELKEEFDAERGSLEGALTDDKFKLVAEIQQVKEDRETKLRNLRMELEVQHLEEKEEMETKFEEIQTDLRRQLREKQEELSGILQDGESGLRGQLKEDFQELVSRHQEDVENRWQEQLETEKETLTREMEEELRRGREQLQEEFDREKYELSDTISGEKMDLLDQYRKEKEELEERHRREMTEMEERAKMDRNKIIDKHSKEIEDLMRMNEEATEDLTKQHRKAMERLQKEKKKLEERLEKEKRRLEELMQTDKERWEEENARIKALHARELEQAREDAEREKDMVEMAVKVEVERAVKREVTEEYEEKMDQVKQTFEDEKADIIAEKELLENKLKMAEVAREEAITTVQFQTQEAALQQARPDRASYDALASERDLLKLSMTGLEEKLQLIKEKADSASQECRNMETKIIALQSEKIQLRNELDDLNKKYLNKQMQASVADSQHARELERIKQQIAANHQEEAARLREGIAERDGRLSELERQLKERTEELQRALSAGRTAEGSEVKRARKKEEEAVRKYRKMRAMLDEYMKKLKEQLAKTTRHDLLLKDLYIENSKLQRALQLTEEQQKTAERNCHNLVEKNQAYLNILRKVCPAAV